jgi:hypothetical protein
MIVGTLLDRFFLRLLLDALFDDFERDRLREYFEERRLDRDERLTLGRGAGRTKSGPLSA